MVAAALWTGLAIAACSTAAVAGDFDRPQPAASARSAAGQTTHKLKWLPYRPDAASAVGEPAAERVVRTAAAAPVRTAQRPSGSAFADPFGDAGPIAEPPILELAPPPGGLPSDDASDDAPPDSEWPRTTPAEPLPIDPLPTASDGPPLFEPPMSSAGPMRPSAAETPLTGSPVPVEKCPLPTDPVFYKRISDLGPDIAPKPGTLPQECLLASATRQVFEPGQVRGSETGQPWDATDFTWKASSLCHKPLYFEDVSLERYGHSWGPYLQPLVSGATFFLTVPALPYKMGLYPPCECMYTLGYYRPGSCAPKMLDPFPLSIRAALVEGGVWTGMAAAIP